MHFLLSSLGLLILLQLTPIAAAEEIFLVARQDAPVESLNHKETANLFLGLGRTSTPLTPFDQRDKQVRKDFYREVAGRSLASVRAHWAKRVFTGRGRPPVMLSSEETDQVIREVPAAVTYVPEDQQPEDSKVLLYLKPGE